MKASELRPCALCGKGVMHSGVPLFYRVTIETMGVDLKAVRERAGLEMMMGSPALAEVFAPTSEIANPVHEPNVALICQTCAVAPQALCLLAINQSAQEAAERGKALA